MTNDISTTGPINSLFCPVCCDGSRYDSDFKLRRHVQLGHLKGMDDPYWKVCKDYCKGRTQAKEFYEDVDEVTESICIFSQ